MQQIAGTKRISILGAPMDLGAGRRGVDMGPSAIRLAELGERLATLGVDVDDRGNITPEIPEVAKLDDESARYLPTILEACAAQAKAVASIASEGRLPIVLGGDHSIAMGTLAGVHSVHGAGGVLWVDAHADMNTPSNTPSGNVHGMPLAAALGACGFTLNGFAGPPWVDPTRVALVGIRMLDPGEKALVREMGVTVLTMSDVDRRGLGAVVGEALDVVGGPGFVHLSLDLDACDPEIAPGVGTPIRGGFNYREAHLAMELLAEADVLTSLEVVEVNPILDHANATGILAVELIASALGASIL